MTDQTCDCGCGTVEQATVDTTSAHQQTDAVADGGAERRPAVPDRRRWIEDGITETELPADLQRAMGQFLGERRLETIDEFFEALGSRLDRERLTVEDLCHTDEETPHWGVLDGERYHFQCFYDAVALAEMTDSETRVRTESPDGTVIEGTATGSGEFTVSPADAVTSFGIRTDIGSPAESVEETYAAICPYVKGFPSREAYERWAADVSAATVAMPMADGTALATLVAE